MTFFLGVGGLALGLLSAHVESRVYQAGSSSSQIVLAGLAWLGLVTNLKAEHGSG